MSNDVIMDVLKSRGYAGHYNDALSSWAKEELGEDGHVNTLLNKIALKVGADGPMGLIDNFKDIFGERWYYNFDGGDDYVQTPTLSMPENFYWKFELSTTEASSEQMVIAGDYRTDYYLRLDENPAQLKFWVADKALVFTAPFPICDGNTHRVELGYRNGWYAKVDGAVCTVTGDLSAQPYTGDVALRIGANNFSARFFFGRIFNVNLNGQYLDKIDRDSTIVNVNEERWAYE